ncbi:hypothetical protein OQA88_2607 [Cercophora sp. LCS_1]
MLQTIISTSLLYTLLVFSGGFICGIIRVPVLEPHLGERYAQLLEMPLMAVVIWKSARLVVKRVRVKTGGASTKRDGVAIGMLALAWFLVIEGGFYLWIHQGEGKSVRDWIRERDPAAGAAFFGLLCVFGLLPGLLV